MYYHFLRRIAIWFHTLAIVFFILSGTQVFAGDNGNLSAGYFHTCGIKTDGTVACWWRDDDKQSTPKPGSFTQIGGGFHHTCGIKTDSTTACWWRNADLQSVQPVGVVFTQIGAGLYHTCGIKTDGTVACWGRNDFGQATPPSGIFTQIGAGIDFTCGLKTNGAAVCWGKNDVGQSSALPGVFTQIWVGYVHVCGLRTNGTIDCFGNADYGKTASQTGVFVQVWAGIDHSCGLKADGTVACWGRNNFGQRNVLSGTFLQISVGSNHACGIRASGIMDCWGRNDYGQSNQSGFTFKSTDKTLFVALSSVPYASSTGIAVNSPIVLNFSKTIDQSTVPGNIVLRRTGGEVISTLASNYAGGTITFSATSPLLRNTSYTVSVYTGLKSTDVKTLASSYSFSFTTAPEPTAPATNVPLVSTSLPYVCSANGISLGHPECSPANTSIVYKNNAIVQKDAATATTVWDPVSLATGDFTYSNTLMHVPWDGLDYDFSLDYKSQAYSNGPVGMNWDYSYNISLRENDDTSVTYFDGRFGTYTFAKNASGSFMRLWGLDADLVKTGTGYELRFTTGIAHVFGSNLKIASIRDKDGHTLSFAYDVDGNLVSTTDTLGRVFTYEYYAHARLKSVTDFSGRSVTLNYFSGADAGGNVYDLKSLVINNGTGSETTGSKTVSFTYQKDASEILSHNLLTLTDSSGNQYVENVYDANDRVLSQKFGDGTLYYSYETVGGSGADANHVTKTLATNKRGMQSEFSFDANGNTVTKKLFEGTGAVTTTYTYGSGGKVATEIKPLGNGTAYKYDTVGRITEKRLKSNMNVADNDAQDIVTKYVYDTDFLTPTKVTDPTGNDILTTIDSKGNIIETKISGVKKSDGSTYDIVNTLAYDTAGHLIIKRDGEGNETHYEYGSGRLVKTIEGTGSDATTTLFAYDAHGNLLTSTDGEGNAKQFTYDPYDRLIHSLSSEWILQDTSYDANNNKTEESIHLEDGKVSKNSSVYDILDQVVGNTVWGSGGTDTRSTSMVRDANGNITESTDAKWLKMKLVYDIFDRVIEKRIIADAGDTSKDIVTKFTYDLNGNVLSSTDARTSITTYEYDGFDRMIASTDVLGTKHISSYDRAGNVTAMEVKDSNEITVSKTERTFDGLGHILKEIKGDVASGSILATVTTDYDRNGKPTKVVDAKENITAIAYDSLGRKKVMTDALGNQTVLTYDKRGLVTKQEMKTTDDKIITITTEYDRDGRRTRTTDSLGNTTDYLSNQLAQVTKVTDALGNQTDYSYDLFGNILSETKYLSGTTTVPLITAYEYDKSNNRTKLTDANGNMTTYTYDALNRLTRETLADNSFVEYEYDKNGNITQKTDANGTVSTNTYDVLNRLTKRTIQRGTNVLGVTEENYTYDALGHLVNTADSAGNALAFIYDPLGRLTSENNSGALVEYEYDANSNRTKLVYPDARESTYSYDPLNRVTDILQNGASIASYSYIGIVNTGISYGNGKNITQTFDQLSRLNTLDNGVKSYTYVYDPTNNITSDYHKNYTYDSISRLTQANDTNSGTLLESFNYDKMGSRTMDANNEYTTNALNQYTSLTGAIQSNYTYDANGNLTNNGVFTFGYDYKNRLIQVRNASDNSIVAEYQYDVLGRRIEKKVGDEVTSYVYAGQDIISETKTDQNNQSFIKTYFNGLGVDNLVAYDQEDVVDPNNTGSVMTHRYYFHKDHLGSIVGITNGSWDTVTEYGYDTFGTVHLKSGTDTGNNRLFTGREYDNETGLYYYRARTYDPMLGRFLQRDPIGASDDVNLYGYVGENPVMGVDPMGTEKKVLQSVTDRMNAYWAYLENNPVLANEFGKIILDDQKMNFKVNPDLLNRSEWIDPNCTKIEDNCWKKIKVDGMDISLADLGNVGYAYVWTKYWYGGFMIKWWAFTITTLAWKTGHKKENPINNEMGDWKYYDTWISLANQTKTWKLTVEDLKNTLLNMKK